MKQKEKVRYQLRKAIYSNALLYRLWYEIKPAIKDLFQRDNCVVENRGLARFTKEIEGEGHSIQIGEGCILQNASFRIQGKNNRIVFEDNCFVGEDCSFWMEGEDITIVIGTGTTFTYGVHFCAQEKGVSILVGEDCMFSNNIIVRTSDSHPMYDLHTGSRINPPKDVVIGKHVWIAPDSKIMKGAVIGDGAIIGSDTMVTKCIPANSLAVGHPAKVVKTDVQWTRESLF